MSVLIRATVREAMLHLAMPLTSLLGVLVASGALGCSSLDPESDTCVSIGNPLDALCQGGAGSGGTAEPPSEPPLWEQDRFACLAPDFRPTPLPPPNATVNLTASVVDYANPRTTALTDLVMSFCQQMDTNCVGDQLPRAVPVPGMAPLVNLTVPAGSNGYLRQEAVGHVRQDYYLLAPMLRDDASLAGPDKSFFLVGTPDLNGFIADLGSAVDPNLGILAFFIEDCDGNRVEGATVRLPDPRQGQSSANVWAINAGYPVLDKLTEADGTAGFVNVPLGTLQVEVVVGRQPYGATRLRVASGRLTAATLRPIYDSGR